MKRTAALFLCLALLVSLFNACGEADTTPDPYKGLKHFESDTGISLYMDKSYKETTIEGVTCTFEGSTSTSAVSCREETFQSLTDLGIDADMSLEDYAAMVIEANQFDGEVLTDEYGNVYFVYEQEIMEISLTYYAFIDKGSTAFWTTNFICPTDEKADHEKDFQLWASSITIE